MDDTTSAEYFYTEKKQIKLLWHTWRENVKYGL